MMASETGTQAHAGFVCMHPGCTEGPFATLQGLHAHEEHSNPNYERVRGVSLSFGAGAL